MLLDKTVKSLPYKLTGAQQGALTEILEDMSAEAPMLRLLQVGNKLLQAITPLHWILVAASTWRASTKN